MLPKTTELVACRQQACMATLVLVSAHNAASQLSRDSGNSRRSPPRVVFSKVHKYNILYLVSLTKASEFHLYYNI